MTTTNFPTSDSEILAAIGARLSSDLDAYAHNSKKKNALEQAKKEWDNWKKFMALADEGIPLIGMHVAKIVNSSTNEVILGYLQELSKASSLVTWEEKNFPEPEQLGNLIPASIEPKNGFTPGDRVSYGDSFNTGTLRFFADGEPVVEFDSTCSQAVVGFRTLEKLPGQSVRTLGTQVLEKLNDKEWRSDIAIASMLNLPLVEVQRELATLVQEKKIQVSSDGREFRALPEQPKPLTPYVLVVEERFAAYTLPKIYRAKALYPTPTTVRCEMESGKQKNLAKQKIYCLSTEADFLKTQNLYSLFQAALDELGSAIKSLGRYDSQLLKARGKKQVPNPLSPTVVLASDPSQDNNYWCAGWKVPTLERLEIDKHTPQMMRLLKNGRDYSLTRQDKGFCCPTDKDWKRVTALHEKAVSCGEEFEKRLETLQTYEQKEKLLAQQGISVSDDTQVTERLNPGGSTQKEATQNGVEDTTVSEEDSVQLSDESVASRKLAVQQETLVERVYALLKLEKRSLVSIAEELGEDRTEITKALYALKEEGRALQAEESERIFWSLPTPKKEIVEQSANEEPREVSTQYPTVLWLNPDDIIIDAGTQSRLKEDEERIDDYKRDMDLGEWDYERRPLPKVAINPDDGRYYAVDCHHRIKAGLLASSCSQMLFEVEQATLAQARLWSTAANTQHGLGADNTPAGVRKRIEMFLDNIELLSPEQYRDEFEKVPDLSEQERRIGRFSDRTITRYLRLRPTQSRTVGNIRKEREMGEQFAHLELEEGVSRIEVVAENPDYPIGSLGLVMQLDKKSGIWVKWDKNGKVWAIHPNLITKTDKPKPLTVGVGSTTPQTQTSKPTSIASYFDPPNKTDSVFPDLKGETPDKGSPETVTPAQEQTSTTPAEYAKASRLLEVQDAALKLAKLSPEQLSEVIDLLADMGLSERHFNAIASSSQNILEGTVRIAV